MPPHELRQLAELTTTQHVVAVAVKPYKERFDVWLGASTSRAVRSTPIFWPTRTRTTLANRTARTPAAFRAPITCRTAFAVTGLFATRRRIVSFSSTAALAHCFASRLELFLVQSAIAVFIEFGSHPLADFRTATALASLTAICGRLGHRRPGHQPGRDNYKS